MQAAVSLEATIRENQTKGEIRAMRKAGHVPAVIYSKSTEPKKLAVKQNELEREYHKGGLKSKVIELKAGKETFHAVTRELQLHPVKDSIEHIDFLAVKADEPVRVAVPVRFVNRERSPGIKRGGTLNVVRHTVELVSTPDKIMDAIVIDLGKTQIGDSIHVSQIELADGVSPAIQDRDFTIATVVGRGGKKDEEETTEGAEGEAAEGEKKE